MLDDVSFTVSPGETVVLAGANGAGKTTLLKILAGLVMPASGKVLAEGVDAFAQPIRFRTMLGYLPESAVADPDLTVRDYLRYRARLKGEMTKKIRHRVEEALSQCGLLESSEVPIALLSQGLRKRTALADAILLRPRILLLDDLLAGLDVATRSSIGRILAAVSSFAAILVTGHELEEWQPLATKYLVLKGGGVLGAKTAAGARTILNSPMITEQRG